MRSWVKCSLLLCLAISAQASIRTEDVIFHLYTRTNPTVSQPLLPIASSIMTSSYSLTKKTIITIHSNGENVSGNFNAFVVPSVLAKDDVNVIAVDWSPGSAMYTIGLSNAPEAGRLIANFINLLVMSFGYNPNLIHIVGVGLGGHIAGIAARNVVGTIDRITALDPSLHGWTHNSNILSPDAANEVEVLHTTGGRNGYDKPLGDIDFYPNGGSAQNGCSNDISCSHIYSYVFFAESIEAEISEGNKFVGRACESYEDASIGLCAGPETAIFGGTESKAGVTGIFFFTTNINQPFAQG